jgi:hypothetical protein
MICTDNYINEKVVFEIYKVAVKREAYIQRLRYNGTGNPLKPKN